MFLNYLRPESTSATVVYRLRNGVEFEMPKGRISVALLSEIVLENNYCPIPWFSPQPGWTVADLGAHVGVWSLYVASQSQDIKIHAFEPSSFSRSLLTKNVHRNKFKNVLIHANAVADFDGNQAFLEEGSTWGYRLNGSGGNMNQSRYSVDAVSLKTLLSRTGPLDLAKMDIEGMELAALMASSPETLQMVSRIAMEYHAVEHQTAAEVGSCISAKLLGAGFRTLIDQQRHYLFAWRDP
ncbi:MAG: FkbM family methyltransferase [Thermomicrobiales bacterium]|nr:FkbM family methyltransferase [Thermomicrobiales bacterium]